MLQKRVLLTLTPYLWVLPLGAISCTKETETTSKSRQIPSSLDAAKTNEQTNKSAVRPQAPASQQVAQEPDTEATVASAPTKPAFSQVEYSQIQGLAVVGGNQLQFFTDTVYPLVTTVDGKATCSTCHASVVAPHFAAPTPAEAFANTVDNAKINLNEPEKSRLYLRIVDKHSCWTDCDKDAATMLAAIKQWATLASQANALGDANDAPTSAALTFNNKTPGAMREVSDPTTIIKQAETATLAGAMVMKDSATALGGKAIHTPDGQAAPDIANANNSQDRATLTFTVATAGMYHLCGLLSAPNANADVMFARVDNGQFVQWTLPATNNPDVFQWNSARLGNGAGIMLTAGDHTVQIRRREDGAIIDAIGLSSSKANCDLSAATTVQVNQLSFDIGDMCGAPGTKLNLDIEEHNNGEAWKLGFPTIVAPAGSGVKITGLEVRINGSLNPQYATFRLVDGTAAAGQTAVLSNASMVVLKEKVAPELDALAVQVGTCSKL